MKSSAIDLLQCLKEALMRCVGGGHGKYCKFSRQCFVCSAACADYPWSLGRKKKKKTKDEALSSNLITRPHVSNNYKV